MKNFIKLTEVKFEETGGSVKVKYYDDYIRPASICFIERIIHKEQRVCLIHFEIGDNHAKLLVKESPEEIDEIIDAGADIIMLPYFKTADEVREFVRLVGGRAKTFPLVENKESVECIDEILEVEGIDEIYIGLNDLTLSRNQRFMFQPLADGTVDMLAEKFKAKGIPFGFGGIASLGKGLIPSEYIICEHKRLGSNAAILSRSFCNVSKIADLKEVDLIFTEGVRAIREFEAVCTKNTPEQFIKNHTELRSKVEEIVEMMGGL